MDKQKFLEAIKKAKEGEGKKFVQTIDLAVTLKDLDMKKQESKFSEDVILPFGRGKELKIAVFAEGELAEKVQKAGLDLLKKSDIEELGKNKKQARKVARKYEYLMSQTDFMSLIGKTLGAVLGPKGKMPKPIPAQADPKPFAERLKKSVRVRVKDQPVIHVPVGTEKMPDEQVAENAAAVITALLRKLPKGMDNIDAAYVKRSMGASVKVTR